MDHVYLTSLHQRLGTDIQLCCRFSARYMYTFFYIYYKNTVNVVLLTTCPSLCIFSPFCRRWDLDRQRACPLLVSGFMFRLCSRLHDAASLRLLFKGLEISLAGVFCALLNLHPLLVVGHTLCKTTFIGSKSAQKNIYDSDTQYFYTYFTSNA